VSKKYENINQDDRDSLESLVAKMVADAYQKGLNHGILEGNSRAKARIIGLLGKHSPAEYGRELVYEPSSLCGDLCHLKSDGSAEWGWRDHFIALIKEEQK
jgi:hypothetical protein